MIACSKNKDSRARGFTVITAIFLVLILSILAVFIIGLGVFQSHSISLDMLGARAYQAAKAGIEAGAYNSLRNDTCAGQTINFGGALTGFTAVVTCTRDTPQHNEGGTLINADTITSTACNQTTCPDTSGAPPSNYVERQLTIVVEK